MQTFDPLPRPLIPKNPYKTMIVYPDIPVNFIQQARKNSLGRAIELNIAYIGAVSNEKKQHGTT